jgi:NO-binding membrane sensor protein with MHYT domain
MHFIGMSAVTMHGDDGSIMEVRYNIGYTLLSLALVLVFSGLGCYISSHDAVFSKTRKEMVTLFLSQSSGMSLQNAVHLNPRQMMWIIGTHNPIYLVCGGLCAGSGVVVMHYVGMAAMEFKGRIVWDAGIIAASCVIAFLAATAAFWILFRFLSVYSNKEYLRIACALIMGVAVCGMHYTGMMAARYESDESVQVSDAATMSSKQAFLSGVLVATCITVAAAIASLSELRYSVWRLSYELNRADETITNLPTTNSHACASQIRRYVSKRRAGRFGLGVINNTYAMDHDDGEDEVSNGSDGNHNGSNNGSHNGSFHGWFFSRSRTENNAHQPWRPPGHQTQVLPITETSEDPESGYSAAVSKTKADGCELTPASHRNSLTKEVANTDTNTTTNPNTSPEEHADSAGDAASAVIKFEASFTG